MSAIELPFLYQTRTILRCSSRAKVLRNVKRNPKSQRLLSTAPSTTRDEPSGSFLSQKAKETAESARRKSKPSITRTEKQVFDEIFHDIKTSSGRPANEKQLENETDPNAILRLFVQEPGQRQIPGTEPAIEYKTLESTSSDWYENIKRYPSSLRHAARQVTRQQATLSNRPDQLPYKSFQPPGPDAQTSSGDRGAVKDPRHGVYRPLDAALETELEVDANSKEGLQLRNFDAMKEDEIARGTFRGKTADYVEKELKSISTELQSCITPKSQSGAFKMWNICQQRILPIVLELNQRPGKHPLKKPTEAGAVAIPELGDSGSGKSTTKKSSKKQATKKSSMKEPPSIPADKHVAPRIPADIPPLSVVTTLYPTLTLLALRLFTTYFPTTHFPLTLYTTLQTTSPQSRILGLNVHFYNTLLRHLWAIYSDLHGIASTLSEMQSSGVDFDGTTYTLIRTIEDERWNEFHTGEGSRGTEWWGRPEQVTRYAEVMEWKGLVARRLQEQGMGHLLAEREYSRELLGRSEMDDTDRPRVWL